MLTRSVLAATAAFVALGACTSSGHGPPTQHRPQAVACPTVDELPADAAPTKGEPSQTTYCATDSDCPGGGVCSCKGETFFFGKQSPSNVCVSANCHVDSDCASGYCSPSVSSDLGSFYGIQGYYCHAPQDTCSNDSDCVSGGYCAYQPTVGSWACGNVHIAG